MDWGARDAFDALEDAAAADQPVDDNRAIATGYSMEGGGAMYLSSLFPDRFAATVAWVPFTGDCYQGTPLAQVRHVPSAYLFGLNDELVWPNHGAAVAQRLDELGYEHWVWEHATEHFTFAILGDWRKEAAFVKDRRLVRRPARVTYRTNAYLYRPKIGILPDGAYWVDELRPRNMSRTPAGDIVVDLTSHACSTGLGVHTTMVARAGVDPVPWVGRGRAPAGTVPIARGAKISGTLTNVKSVLIDVSSACLKPGRPISLDLKTDGPTIIRFSDGRPLVTLRAAP